MKHIDWHRLGFHLTETDYIVRSAFHGEWQDGQLVGEWQEPYATKDKYIRLHLSATCLQYGQEAFEGLKAFPGVDGKIRIFRWQENAKRLQRSAEALKMAAPPVDLFGRAVRLALERNIAFVPPYETGATLYFRPLLIGTTPRLGVGPGTDFELVIIPSPIGPYYQSPDGDTLAMEPAHCTTFIVNRHIDRAAPFGTGQFKVGGNYAASFRATEAAHLLGYDCLFLDSRHHRYIDECSAANFIGIQTHTQPDGTAETLYLTPRSTAILPSITNHSLMTLARDMGMRVVRRRIRLEELVGMQEAAACGTACVISPIDKVIDLDNNRTYCFSDRPGPVLGSLYKALQDIQYGRASDRHKWCTVIDNTKQNKHLINPNINSKTLSTCSKVTLKD